MENLDNTIPITYDSVKYNHKHHERAFFYWLKRIKSYKGCKGFHPSELDVYIDTTKVKYDDLMSLWALFESYKVKGREQIEKLLPYLPKDHQDMFREWRLGPWKKRLLKSKNKN